MTIEIQFSQGMSIYNEETIDEVTEKIGWLKILHFTLLHATVVLNKYWLKRIFYALVPVNISYSESISVIIVDVVTVLTVVVH